MDAVLVWFFIGVGLVLLELFTPVFIFIFLGLGAWVAAIMASIFPGLEQELITFMVVTLLSLLVLRRKMVTVFQGKQSHKNPTPPPYVGRQAEVVRDISPKREGEIAVGGSFWRATASTSISKGDMVIVLSCAENDELLLIVEPIL